MCIKVKEKPNVKKSKKKAEESKSGRVKYREDQCTTDSKEENKEKEWVGGVSHVAY